METVLLVTSNDYWLAPLVARELRAKGRVVRILDVALPTSSDLAKRLKLAVLFGIRDTLGIFMEARRNRADSGVAHVSEAEAHSIVAGHGGPVMLMNYPKKFPVLDKPVFNFHPATLPSYRGLMSLPRGTYDWFRGYCPVMGATIHEIAATFDTGRVRWQRTFPDTVHRMGQRAVYELAYGASAAGLDAIQKGEPIPPMNEDVEPTYSREMTWGEVLALKVRRAGSKLGIKRRERWIIYTARDPIGF